MKSCQLLLTVPVTLALTVSCNSASPKKRSSAPAPTVTTEVSDTLQAERAAVHRHFPGAEIVYACSGDINNDQVSDAVLLTRIFDSLRPKRQIATRLIILTGERNTFRLRTFNDKLCNYQGFPRKEDRSVFPEIVGNEIHIAETVGACARTEFLRTFRYDTTLEDWIQGSFRTTDYNCNEPEKAKISEQTGADFGIIRFADAVGGY